MGPITGYKNYIARKQMARSKTISTWLNIKFPENILYDIRERDRQRHSEPVLVDIDANEVIDTPEIDTDGFEIIYHAVQQTNITNEEIITKEEIRLLARESIITLPGLPQFTSGYTLIQKEGKESDDDFALRQLHALLRIYINAENPAIKLLNTLHIMDDPDRTLAGTAYYFDAAHHRLIIRHAPVEMRNEREVEIANNEINRVTKIITDTLGVSENAAIQVEHVIPCVQEGILWDHMVLKLRNAKGEIIFDPRSQWSSDEENYHYVSVQKFLNNTACGFCVTIMANIAARLMAENPETTTQAFIVEDFANCQILKEAVNCETPDKLQSLLEKPTFLPVKYQPAPKSNTEKNGTYLGAFFRVINKTFGGSSSDLTSSSNSSPAPEQASP